MEKEAFMQAAIEESRHNLETNEGGPFGAVIVKNGKSSGAAIIRCWPKMTPPATRKSRPSGQPVARLAPMI